MLWHCCIAQQPLRVVNKCDTIIWNEVQKAIGNYMNRRNCNLSFLFLAIQASCTSFISLSSRYYRYVLEIFLYQLESKKKQWAYWNLVEYRNILKLRPFHTVFSNNACSAKRNPVYDFGVSRVLMRLSKAYLCNISAIIPRRELCLIELIYTWLVQLISQKI